MRLIGWLIKSHRRINRSHHLHSMVPCCSNCIQLIIWSANDGGFNDVQTEFTSPDDFGSLGDSLITFRLITMEHRSSSKDSHFWINGVTKTIHLNQSLECLGVETEHSKNLARLNLNSTKGRRLGVGGVGFTQSKNSLVCPVMGLLRLLSHGAASKELSSEW